jgi:hypothetical protein
VYSIQAVDIYSSIEHSITFDTRIHIAFDAQIHFEQAQRLNPTGASIAHKATEVKEKQSTNLTDSGAKELKPIRFAER